MSSLNLDTRSKKKQRTKQDSYQPDPPIIKENRNGRWIQKAGWKLGGPSGLGKMAGKDSYGTTRDQYIAEIWEKCQPDYFQAMMNKYCGGKLSKKKMQEKIVDEDIELSGSKPNPDGWHRKNGGFIGELIKMEGAQRYNKFKKVAQMATKKFILLDTDGLKNWKEKEEEIYDMFLSEIKKRTYTSGGTADEESDIQNYLSNVDWKTVKRGDINLLPSCCNYDAFKDSRGNEKWLNYEWNPSGEVGWPGRMAAHLDGILIGKGVIKKEGSKTSQMFKFFDVFEAKQRQGKQFKNIGGPGIESERLQCALYCMMLVERPERTKWQNTPSVVDQKEATCGSWLLQTLRDNKDKQSLDFLPMSAEQFEKINDIVSNFLRDLNLTQAYHFKEGTPQHSKSEEHQKRICKSAASPI